MEPHEFSFFQWLANLLGPGGFVATIAAAGEGWFIYKLYHWHHSERKETQAECALERKGWIMSIETINLEKAARFKDYRKDIKEQYVTINSFKESIDAFGAIVRRGDRRRKDAGAVRGHKR